MATLAINTPRWLVPLLEHARYKGAHGGRGCVHPDTPIDVPGGTVPIKNFNGGLVWSWKDGRKVVAFATKARPFTAEQLYEVGFSDGRSIIVTDQHKFLTGRGWKELQNLCASDGVFSLPQKCAASLVQTIGGICQPMSLANDPRLIGTHEDCRADCSECRRLCGLQLLSAKDSGQAFLPSQGDARQHSSHAWSRSDGLACVDTHTPSSTSHHQPSPCAPAFVEAQCCAASGSCSGGISFERPLEFSRSDRQCPLTASHSPQDRSPAALHQDFDIDPELDETLRTLFGKQRDNGLYDPCETPVIGEFMLTRIAFVRKHSRQTYWDLHVFGTNNYLSNGLVNHNSGKSHAFAEMVIEAHVMDQRKRTVCVREIQKSLAQSVKRLLEMKIEELGVQAYFEVQEACIKSRRGDGMIIFAGMQNHTADSIKSLEGYDCAWVEEAQSLSQRSLDLLRPTIRKPGSELWFTWNPRQASDPIDALLRGDNPPPDAAVVQVNYTDNPWFPEVLRAEMEYDKRRDPDKHRHIWLGDYLANSEARVFRNWVVEEFEAPPEAVHRFGADWGFASDPTVLVRCHIIGRKLFVDYEAWMIGCDIMDTPSLFMQVPDSERWPIVADSARPETISHMRKNGFPKIMGAVKGPKSLAEGVEWLKSYDMVIHPRCEHLIDELTCYSYKEDPLTGKVLPVLEDKHNHIIDALRYACEAVRRNPRNRVPDSEKIVVRRYADHRGASAGWLGS